MKENEIRLDLNTMVKILFKFLNCEKQINRMKYFSQKHFIHLCIINLILQISIIIGHINCMTLFFNDEFCFFFIFAMNNNMFI